VFRVDPTKYTNYADQQADTNVRMVDRIEDLPPPSEEIMRILQNYNQQSSADENTEHPSNFDHLTNVTRSSNIPAHRQERVLSPGQTSSIPSPVMAPYQSKPRQSNDSPIQLKTDDIY
jgi:hypothetical protein